MSQYPFQYPPGPHPQASDPFAALLAPARRAAILMFILGGCSMLCGACAGIFSLLDLSHLPQAQMDQLKASEAAIHAQMPGVTLQGLMGFIGIVTLVLGVLLIAIAFFVRRGTRGGAIAGMCLVGPVMAYLLFDFFAVAMSGAQAAAGLVFLILPLGACVLLLTWLIQAFRNAAHLPGVQAQYQAQYQQYQQQAMMYGHVGGIAPPPSGQYGGPGGTGYGAPPMGFAPGQGTPWQQPNWPLQPPPPPPPPPGTIPPKSNE